MPITPLQPFLLSRSGPSPRRTLIWHLASTWELHPGALADLSLINLKKRTWLYPFSNMVSHLVYSMTGGVDTTIVNGKLLMRDGVIPGEAAIIEEAQKRFERLVSQAE